MLHYRVIFRGFLIERETIGQTAAPAAGYEYPQLERAICLSSQEGLYLSRSTR
jgi:hypothetical protein